MKNELKYRLISDYKDNDNLRRSFNKLTKETYGFDFEFWYVNGYWQDKYIPYSLLDGEEVIANVSVNIMNFEINNKLKHYLQLGTVMTNHEYRNHGLSRYLIHQIIDEWKNKVDDIYLFANDTVLEFYPKFGFHKCEEYQYYKVINPSDADPNTTLDFIKIDMLNKQNREKFIQAVNNCVCNSKMTMKNNIGLMMFYTTSSLKDSVYYLPKINTYVIAEIDDNVLILHDVISSQSIDLELVIQAFSSFNIAKVILGFTPHNTEKYMVSLMQEDNTTLFILGNDLESVANNKMMFPTLSHA